jgi:hypothetical protein
MVFHTLTQSCARMRRYNMVVPQSERPDGNEGEPQAFGRWFASLFFMSPRDIFGYLVQGESQAKMVTSLYERGTIFYH